MSTRNGIATNVWASTTPAVVNGRRMPNQRSRYWPTSPRRPRAKNSATPPTTGGSTIDSVHRARTTPRPGKSTRASSQASGTPNTQREPGRPQRRRRATAAAPCRTVASVRIDHSRPPRRPPQQADERQGEERDGDAPGEQRPGRATAAARRRRDPGRVVTGDAIAARSSAAAAVIGAARRRNSARIVLAGVAEHELDERGGAVGVGRLGGGGDRVLGDDVDVGGDLHAVGVVPGGDRRRWRTRCRRRPRRASPWSRCLDVLLQRGGRDRRRRRSSSTCWVYRADRHRRIAGHDDEVGVGEVRDAGDARAGCRARR